MRDTCVRTMRPKTIADSLTLQTDTQTDRHREASLQKDKRANTDRCRDSLTEAQVTHK